MAGQSSRSPWDFLSTDQSVDIIGADADLVVMRAGRGDIIIDVVMADRVAVLVEPHQRAGDDEEYLHRIGMLVADQRMALAGGFVDEVPRGRGPVMFEIGPFAADRVGPDRVRMIMP